jgi:hypothetical protein
MACTSCNDSSGNKNKSAKSSTSGGSTGNVFKSGMNLLIQAKRIWQEAAENPVEPTPPVEPTQPEQNNDTNV